MAKPSIARRSHEDVRMEETLGSDVRMGDLLYESLAKKTRLTVYRRFDIVAHVLVENERITSEKSPHN